MRMQPITHDLARCRGPIRQHFACKRHLLRASLYLSDKDGAALAVNASPSP